MKTSWIAIAVTCALSAGLTGLATAQELLDDPVLPDSDVLLVPAFDSIPRVNEGSFPDDLIEIILPASPPTAADLRATATDDALTVSFPVLPRSQLSALPIGTGFPEPSIVVGVLNPDAAAPGAEDEASPGFAFEFTDDAAELANLLGTLRTMKTADPVVFATLLDTGMLDPPEGRLLIMALQSELTRMGCYNRGVDGQWGAGSVAGAQAYLRELDPETRPDVSANADLFRLVMRSDDVACPAPPPRRQPAIVRPGNSPGSQPVAAPPRRVSPPATRQPVAPREPVRRQPASNAFDRPFGNR